MRKDAYSKEIETPIKIEIYDKKNNTPENTSNDFWSAEIRNILLQTTSKTI